MIQIKKSKMEQRIELYRETIGVMKNSIEQEKREDEKKISLLKLILLIRTFSEGSFLYKLPKDIFYYIIVLANTIDRHRLAGVYKTKNQILINFCLTFLEERTIDLVYSININVLFEAIWRRNTVTINALLKRKNTKRLIKHTMRNNRNVLEQAIKTNDIEVLELMNIPEVRELESNIKNGAFVCALQSKCSVEVLKFLKFSMGFEPKFEEHKKGVLYYASYDDKDGHLDFLKSIGIKDTQDEIRYSCLNEWICHKNSSAAIKLIDKGFCNLNAVSGSGETYLTLAVYNNLVTLTERILREPITIINAQTKVGKKTAIIYSKVKKIRLMLLGKGADIFIEDVGGKNAVVHHHDSTKGKSVSYKCTFCEKNDVYHKCVCCSRPYCERCYNALIKKKVK